MGLHTLINIIPQESTTVTMSQEQLKSECVEAFEHDNREDAEQLLLQLEQPADIKTTTDKASVVTWNARDLSYKSTPLHSVDNLEKARYFINEQNCDPMARDSNGNTPLHCACRYGRLNIAQYLIRQACNPSSKNKYGDTPHHLASRYGHLNITQYLVSEAHCNPSCKNNNGDTPLHYACRYNHLNITQYLVSEAHCNPSCRNNNGDTPLHLACHYGHLNIAHYLISEAHCNPLLGRHGSASLCRDGQKTKWRLQWKY